MGGVIVEGADVGAQREELFLGFSQLFFIGGVEGVAQGLQRDADDVAGVVNHHNAVLERRVPQVLIAGNLNIHHRRIVDNQRGAGGVGHGVLVVLVIVLGQEGRIQVLVVGQQLLVQFQQLPVLAQHVQRVVASQNHIKAVAGRLHFDDHFLIGEEGGIVHLDAGFLGELGDGGVIDIGGPAEDVEHRLFLGQSGHHAQHQE